ncbi:hypothetical protein J4403_03165 [Candidatus Woesearchaeota archaeon]|nr:hypothetical protein [Candidatus Woesearchaeota archaeon]
MSVETKVKKGVLLGLGILDLTKEKTEKLIKETAKQQGLSVKEGRKLVESVLRKNKKQGKIIADEIESKLSVIVSKALSLSRQEIEKMERKLNEKRGVKMGSCSCCKPKSKKKAKSKKKK